MSASPKGAGIHCFQIRPFLEKTMSQQAKKCLLVVAAFALVVCLVTGLALVFERVLTHRTGAFDSALEHALEQRIVTIDGIDYQPKNVTTYLIIGLDADGELESSGSFNNEVQADFLMLMIVDPQTETWQMLQLNRDTMTPIKTLDIFCRETGWSKPCQLALSHTYGDGTEQSCRLTEDAVSNLLYGVKIDRYFALTMGAIPHLTDVTGPLTVTVPDDMTAIHPDWVEGATVTLEGEDARLFVQSRGALEDSTNLARMQRQRVFVEALVAAMASSFTDKTETEMYSAYKTFMDYICTDSPVVDTLSLFRTVQQYAYIGTSVPDGTTEMGTHDGEPVMEFYVDENHLKSLVISLLLTEAN